MANQVTDQSFDKDVLNSDNSTQSVSFNNGTFCLKNSPPLHKLNLMYWEIIGNIYETPNLN
jgi:hypothetical protein